MGIRVSQLAKRQQREAKVVLDFGDEGSLTLTFDPSKLTVGRVKRLSRAGRENDFGAVAEEFFDILIDWDLLDDEGNTMPFTEETVDALGIDVFVQIVAELGKQQGQLTTT